MKYEYPQGRRVNAPGRLRASVGCTGAVPFERTFVSGDLLAYLRERLAADVPRVAVPDNAGIHTSGVVRAARPGRAKLGTFAHDLPATDPHHHHPNRLPQGS